MAIPLGYLLDWLIIGQKMNELELLGASLIFGMNVTIASLRICN
jgi:hypothetical protein